MLSMYSETLSYLPPSQIQRQVAVFINTTWANSKTIGALGNDISIDPRRFLPPFVEYLQIG